MPQFIALLQQPGGCDYTIHCGLEAKRFEAESLTAAVFHVVRMFHHPEEPWNFGENEIAEGEVTVIQVHEERKLDTASIADRVAEARAAASTTNVEATERAELARLQAKYGAK